VGWRKVFDPLLAHLGEQHIFGWPFGPSRDILQPLAVNHLL